MGNKQWFNVDSRTCLLQAEEEQNWNNRLSETQNSSKMSSCETDFSCEAYVLEFK